MDGPYILLSCDIQLKWIVSVNLNSIYWTTSQKVQDGCQRWGGVRGFHGGGHLHRCHRHGNRSLNHPCCLQSSGTLNLDKPSCVTFSCYLDSLLISSPKYTIPSASYYNSSIYIIYTEKLHSLVLAEPAYILAARPIRFSEIKEKIDIFWQSIVL